MRLSRAALIGLLALPMAVLSACAYHGPYETQAGLVYGQGGYYAPGHRVYGPYYGPPYFGYSFSYSILDLDPPYRVHRPYGGYWKGKPYWKRKPYRTRGPKADRAHRRYKPLRPDRGYRARKPFRRPLRRPDAGARPDPTPQRGAGAIPRSTRRYQYGAARGRR